MNRRVRQAAFRILGLIEEFSSAELAGAIALIGARGEEDLLTFLARTTSRAPRQAGARSRKEGVSVKTRPRLLQQIKHTDPEKYRLLCDFESQVRDGSILRTLDDFRAFGTILNKEYSPGKSRKEAISRLMNTLVHMDVEAIRAALARIPPARGDDDDAFHRLADEIISGGRSRPSGG